MKSASDAEALLNEARRELGVADGENTPTELVAPMLALWIKKVYAAGFDVRFDDSGFTFTESERSVN
jgi:hypothetical protein